MSEQKLVTILALIPLLLWVGMVVVEVLRAHVATERKIREYDQRRGRRKNGRS